MTDEHVPVLYEEVLALLRPSPGGRYVDGTVGAGGHATGILEASAPDGQLLALDRDPEAIAFAKRRIAQLGQQVLRRVTFVNASFAELVFVAQRLDFTQVDGILFDLGLSSRQLDDPQRGFAFRFDGPLDMRFDPAQTTTAADLVNNLSETELAELFWRYGEERHSRRYAKAIVAARPLQSTPELAELVARHAPRQQRKRIHPATQVFQALRIAVNDELGALERGLPAALALLKPGGRLAVISFHSLEDRFVKQRFRELARDCVCPPRQPICTCDAQATVRLVTRKPVQASEEEVARNPRSRSARLRVAQKLEESGRGTE